MMMRLEIYELNVYQRNQMVWVKMGDYGVLVLGIGYWVLGIGC